MITVSPLLHSVAFAVVLGLAVYSMWISHDGRRALHPLEIAGGLLLVIAVAAMHLANRSAA